MKKKLATQKPNQSPITLTDAQNQITLLMQRAFLEGWNDKKIAAELIVIIENAVQGLPIEDLAEDAIKSLYNHANRVKITLSARLNPIKLRESVALYNSFEHSKFREKVSKHDFNEEDIHIERTESGMPFSFWNAREYIRKRVLPVMDELSQMQALDPNDYTGRNSLRNLAEMEVRYHNHELSIQELKADNEKLVVCSTHADCSKRCAPYQGRVYSLNGTSGKTDDGRDYVPLEEATQNPEDRYPTKAGKVYQNGLLGFNCRHKLRPYISGIKPEEVSEEERKKQYRINNEERSRERYVRKLKLKSDLYKGFDEEKYKKNKYAADKASAAYKEFCNKNSRAFYSERLQVLHPSTEEQREKYRKIEGLTQRYMHDIIINNEPVQLNLKMNKEGYEKHDRNSKRYDGTRSYLTIPPDKAQEIILKYAKIGIPVFSKGKFRNRIRIETEGFLGVNVLNGQATETKSAILHIGKNGTHLVPAKGDEDDRKRT